MEIEVVEELLKFIDYFDENIVELESKIATESYDASS